MIRELAARAWHAASLALGALLRAGRYSSTRVTLEADEPTAMKRRALHAPILIWLGEGLMRVLDTGVRVLGHREWEARERRMYQGVYGSTVRVEGRCLVLPFLPGRPLASLLDDPLLERSSRARALELAVAALAGLHKAGLTHADAMAENVMVDLTADTASWFDFETIHDLRRPVAWRRADDVRALLASCLVRTAPDTRPQTLDLILDQYADIAVLPHLAESFSTKLRRSLPFHLGQAPLSFASYQEVSRLLIARENLTKPSASSLLSERPLR